MQLVLDEGNSALKIGIFDGKTLLHHQVVTLSELESIIQDYTIDRSIFSSVKKEAIVPNCLPHPIQLSVGLNFPFEITYETPQTLGVDRLAAVAGARSENPSSDLLVIDIGTYITFDFLIDNSFAGGMISPGPELRAKAMHNYTSALPLVNLESPKDITLVGESTVESMSLGIMNGITAEIEGIIDQARAKLSVDQVYLTGGGSYLFESMIKAPIFVDQNLVLKGLNSILLYNE